MKTFIILTLIKVWENFPEVRSIVGPPVSCHGDVPQISEGKYYFHDNGTFLVRFSTNIELTLDLNQRSCFQVNLLDSSGSQESKEKVVVDPKLAKLSSLFYSFRYLTYEQTYDVRSEYEFGIAELQSSCRCDCPKGESFCTHEFQAGKCSKGEVCVRKFHSFQNNFGCSESGPANLCCEIFVRPFQGRRFTAVSFVDPRSQTRMEIEIYTQYEGKWNLFRRYQRTILPFGSNTLRLNGYENVADMYVRASSDSPQFYLKNGDKWYFYENTPHFKLFDDRRINGLYERDANKFGWLRYEEGRWNVGDPMGTLYTLQIPRVTDCKRQKYTDRYDINFANVVVIRNSTGAINAQPYLGVEVTNKQTFIQKIRLGRSKLGQNRDTTLTASFIPSAAPSLRLDVKLHQKMSIIAHAFASYLEDFACAICLDKYSNRYLNITLVKSYGEFSIEVYRDRIGEDMDLVLSLTTKLPFATNYSEILPLPGFVSSSRLVCVFAANKPKNRLCKWSSFEKEPRIWFQLRNTFIRSQGTCPGCNRAKSGGFLSNLNPKNWFDGVSSISEGLAMILEVLIYIIVLIIVVALWQKCLYPLLKWALCSKGEYRIVRERAVKKSEQEV